MSTNRPTLGRTFGRQRRQQRGVELLVAANAGDQSGQRGRVDNFLIILQYIGVLVYVIARGSGMAQRDRQQAITADRAARSYIQSAAGRSASVAEEVSKLAARRDQGVLTEQEFETQKAKVLG